MRLTATLDCKKLPPKEADHLKRLIDATAFFAQPASLRSATPGGDRFQFEVTVEDGGRRKTLEMDESSVPDTLRPLLEYLLDFARASRKTKG